MLTLENPEGRKANKRNGSPDFVLLHRHFLSPPVSLSFFSLLVNTNVRVLPRVDLSALLCVCACSNGEGNGRIPSDLILSFSIRLCMSYGIERRSRKGKQQRGKNIVLPLHLLIARRFVCSLIPLFTGEEKSSPSRRQKRDGMFDVCLMFAYVL